MKVFNCCFSLVFVDIAVKIEQELPSKTNTGGFTHSTGNGDFEVSDDDYTSERVSPISPDVFLSRWVEVKAIYSKIFYWGIWVSLSYNVSFHELDC